MKSASSSSSSSPYRIHIIQALKSKVHDEAMRILKRVEKVVAPIMRKHKWRVVKLVEFVPKDASLLGMNVNRSKIMIRMRRNKTTSDFLPFDHILCTMLHELVHMKFSAHNAKFYALLDELKVEAENLLSGGTLAFDSAGSVLGGSNVADRNLSVQERRKAALHAAEKRRKHQNLVGGTAGGRRLGGAFSSNKRLTPRQIREAAAEAAAARAKIDKGGCRAISDGVLVIDDDDSGKNTKESLIEDLDCKKRSENINERKITDLTSPIVSGKCSKSKKSFVQESDGPGKNIESILPWSCSQCTFKNAPRMIYCEICNAPKPTTLQNNQLVSTNTINDKKKHKLSKPNQRKQNVKRRKFHRGTPAIDLTNL